MARKLQNLRNIGIIAHIDAGKTTVTERMLFLSGNKHRVGKVDSGTTTTDDDAEEQDRGITIYAACVTFDWKDIHINLLERQADKYNVPRVAFINKLDREGADFRRVLGEMKDRLNANPVPIQMPVGLGPAHVDDPFRGIVDLIKMRYSTFEDEGKTVNEGPIPEELMDDAQLAREEMLESLYTLSDEMTELALSEEDIPNDLIRKVLRQGTLERVIQPVVCGSALHGIGVQGVLDSVKYYLPTPLDRPPVVGTNPKKEKIAEKRSPDPKEPFSALVFKILPAKTGDLYWVRIYSGELKSNQRVYCSGQDKKENVAQLWQINAT